MLLSRVAILPSPFRRERSQRNTLAWTRTARSRARCLRVDSVARAVAKRVVDGSGVEEVDAEAVARSRDAMGRCTGGAEVVAKVLLS